MSVVDENIVVNLITIYDKQEICNVSEHYIDQIVMNGGRIRYIKPDYTEF